MTSVPTRIEHLTAEWLGQALEPRFPGTRVENARVLDVNAATATKVRLALDYNEIGRAHGLPATMIAKGAFGRNAEAMEHTFTDEMRAYRDVVEGFGINSCKCFYAGKEGIHPMLLLEDLATPDCEFSDPHRLMSRDEAKDILGQLALLHARYWQHPGLRDDGEFGWVLKTVTGWHLEFMEAFSQPEQWALFSALPRGCAMPQRTLRDLPRLRSAMHRQFAFHQAGDPVTLCHGDAHVWNVFFNAKGGGLIDWEMRRSPWYHDVTYFLVTSLDIPDRRAWERELLEHYLDRLRDLGIDAPDSDTAWDRYSREIIYGYMLFVMNGNGTQYWDERANTVACSRYGAALEDLGTLSRIEAVE